MAEISYDETYDWDARNVLWRNIVIEMSERSYDETLWLRCQKRLMTTNLVIEMPETSYVEPSDRDARNVLWRDLVIEMPETSPDESSWLRCEKRLLITSSSVYL